MKIICSLLVTKHNRAKVEIDLSGNFNRAAIEHKLKQDHPWFYKNRDRLKIERKPDYD